MRPRLALIPALICAASLALPAPASAAAPRLRTAPLQDLLFVVLGIESPDPFAGGSDESDDTDPDADGDGASDGLADDDSSSNPGGGSAPASGTISTDSNYTNGGDSSANAGTESTLGNGREGGAQDPSATTGDRFLTGLVDWAIGIIFGQDRPWEDRKAKPRG